MTFLQKFIEVLGFLLMPTTSICPPSFKASCFPALLETSFIDVYFIFPMSWLLVFATSSLSLVLSLLGDD